MPLECEDCKGTGMITLQTTKTPQFKPEDIAGEPASNHLDAISGDEADAIYDTQSYRESMEREKVEKESQVDVAREKIDEQINDILEAPKKGSDDMEFEPKYNEPPEGEMPL